MLDASAIKLCTFDCYGTLVDWERGLLACVQPILCAHGVKMSKRELGGEIIEVFAREERAIEAGVFMSYADVCAENMRRIAAHFDVTLEKSEAGALGESIQDWPAFDETPAALRVLKQRFKLGVLSNIDDDFFAHTAAKLGAQLDFLVTSQQVRSYKPKRAHFEQIFLRSGLLPSEILHIAESRYHDIAPASELGMRTVWVNRHGDVGPSASGASDAQADISVGSLAELVKVLAGE